ncbi:MAG: efflux transporter outer membrane subunit [Holophagales bacterium]|nr:efflux transporter outer membrane subunit [Holophagales bacterium]
MKRTRLPHPAAALLLTALLVGGCTLGPDPERPVTGIDDAEGFVHAPAPGEPAPDGAASRAEPATESTDQPDVEPWWRSFGDPATAELVETALGANTDLRAAAARVLEAQTRLRSARGARWPELSASVDTSRTRSSFTLPEVGRVAVYSTTLSPSLDIAYQVDLFGRLKRSEQAAWSDLLAEEAARETVTHTVIAEVVRARTQLSTLGRARDIARETRDSWSKTLETTERRYRAGLAAALDLRLARENLASADADLVLAEQQLEQSRLGLDVLLGRRPGTGAGPDQLLDPLPALDPVPLGLPADLLDRRPDLRQGEMQLAAATSRVGVAMANLFPNLSLTGSLGSSSDTVSDLLSSDTFVFNLVSNLVAPIFSAGQRRAEVEAARARAEQAAAAYAGSILRALREVEDALVRDNAARERLGHLERRVEEARAAQQIAEERYRRGVLPLLQVLETERRQRQAENALITAQGETWSTRVDLFLALGGDWTGADPVTADPETLAPAAPEPAARASLTDTNPPTESPHPDDFTPTASREDG